MRYLNSSAEQDPKVLRLRRRGISGIALLEFTVVLPLLLIVLFGIIEISLVLYNQAMITNAAREGARFGTLFNVDGAGAYSPHGLAEIQAVVNNYLQGHLISFAAANATVTTPTVGSATGDALTVRVEYTYTFLILPNFANSLAGNWNLAAEAVMRME
jgi:Flp pilus assembly protein TadG